MPNSTLNKNMISEGNKYFQIGKEHLSKKKFEISLKYFDKSIDCGFEDGVYEYRGMCLQALNFDLDAIDDFDKAIVQKAGDPNLYFMRGLSKSSAGYIVESIIDFGVAVELSKSVNELNKDYNSIIKENGWQSITDFYNSYLIREKNTLDMATKEQNMSEELKEKIWGKEDGKRTYPHWKKINKLRR
jgi:tetratricopeptide (TPR) repeat protein